ncbi:redox-regulated ATPase YchF [Candidatus Roizmanbacteria bacterium]|nr:redox-regulated ATPase YchF [Candidatus Roizmanbacteria bacterium]
MKLSVGIVGLPNVGKSTLFNALVTKHKAGIGAHPFTTIDKNIGVVEVPDDTLFQLAKIENIAKVTPATITFVDIAGLIKGAHQGEGLGNQFLHHIREVDLILHVVRFFQNEEVSHVHPKIDPEEDIAIVDEELLLSDLQSLERRLKKEKVEPKEKVVVGNLVEKLNQGVAAREIDLSDSERAIVKPLNLITQKKQVIVANIDEKQLANPPRSIDSKDMLPICAKLEAELIDLPWVEQQQFLKTYGLLRSAKEEIVATCYRSLDIITFYTIAKRTEARAWPIRHGSTASVAAGAVHTDFAKRFIKVEAINAEELIKDGSWKKAHEMGKVLIHGREYQVQDKDVLEFKVGAFEN